MYKTVNICYPRSGHRLLTGLIEKYFRSECHCGTVYGRSATSFANPFVNYLKDHDFNLDVKVDVRFRYLVQIRYPMESIVSHYKLEVGMFNLDDSVQMWRQFASLSVPYWIGFYNKWLLNDLGVRRHVCDYADLIDNPRQELSNVVDFLGGKIDNQRIADVVKSSNVKRMNNLKEFKYYDRGFFEDMNSMFDGGMVNHSNRRVQYEYAG